MKKRIIISIIITIICIILPILFVNIRIVPGPPQSTIAQDETTNEEDIKIESFRETYKYDDGYEKDDIDIENDEIQNEKK